MDEIQLALEELRRQILDQIPPEQILERLSVKERLKGLSPEQILEGLSPDDLLKALTPEFRAELARRLQEGGSCPG